MTDTAKRPYIYLVCTWGPLGGGMYRLMDYLIQAQAPGAGSADLRALDARGGGPAVMSAPIALMAMLKVLWGRLTGRLVGVHVNMADRLSVFRKGCVIVFARAIGLPVVLHVHAAQLHHFYRGLPAWVQRVVRWIFACAGAVVVLGPRSRAFVVDELRVAPRKVLILINGVPHASVPRGQGRWGREDRDGGDQSVFNILFLVNLEERKGVTDLMRALALPLMAQSQGAWRAQFAGSGDLVHYWSVARSLGLTEHTQMLGWAGQAQVAQLLACADVLVLPSYDEGLPLAILEALASGTPVICTPVGEIPSVLTDGVNALFVQPGDVDGLGASLCRLMNEPLLGERLACAGRDLYETAFSLDAFFSGVAQIHQRSFGFRAAQTRPTADI